MSVMLLAAAAAAPLDGGAFCAWFLRDPTLQIPRPPLLSEAALAPNNAVLAGNYALATC
jgi:hypothetical protein